MAFAVLCSQNICQRTALLSCPPLVPLIGAALTQGFTLARLSALHHLCLTLCLAVTADLLFFFHLSLTHAHTDASRPQLSRLIS